MWQEARAWIIRLIGVPNSMLFSFRCSLCIVHVYRSRIHSWSTLIYDLCFVCLLFKMNPKFQKKKIVINSLDVDSQVALATHRIRDGKRCCLQFIYVTKTDISFCVWYWLWSALIFHRRFLPFTIYCCCFYTYNNLLFLQWIFW